MTQKAYVTNGYLSDIASAIRYKNGQSSTYLPFEMASAIRDIPSGGDIDGLIQRTLTSYTGSPSRIGDYAFYNYSSLTNVSFPVCTSIGSSAFISCSSLLSANFPECTSISGYAFAYCSSLANVSFPVCTTIDNYAFFRCTSLAEANFPVCTSIGDFAFRACSSLTEANFPKCTYIGGSVFYSCTSLSKLSISTSNCTLGNINAFIGTPMSQSSYLGYFGSIYVPSEYLSYYLSATNWSRYSARIVGY